MLYIFFSSPFSFLLLFQISDEVYSYNCSDVLVQSSWELPIIVQCSNSTVTYEFTSNQGDISFGIELLLENNECQIVEEPRRIAFSEQPFHGSFELSARGVVVFTWNNLYDWTGEKRLSYMVRIQQVSPIIDL